MVLDALSVEQQSLLGVDLQCVTHCRHPLVVRITQGTTAGDAGNDTEGRGTRAWEASPREGI